ncbi:MAG: amidohydrolase family protein [Myxococcota bacterium]
MERILFRGARLLDGTSPSRPGTSVLIEGERIRALGPDGELSPAPGDRVIDLAGKTLMPGLICAHYHAAYDDVTLQPVPLGTERPHGYLAIAAARNVERALLCGFTSVVSAGGPHNIDAELKQAIEAGLIDGPRIVAGSRGLDTVGDYNDIGPWWWELGNPGANRYCNGADGFREAARDEIRIGAEIIKIFPAGGHGIPEPETTRGLTRDELRAVVEATHDRGRKIRAHCPWKKLILECIEVGVDVIDHGDRMDAEVIQAMVESGTFLAPSMLFLARLLGDAENRAAATAAQLAPIQDDFENMCKWLPEASAAGVKIVLGDDYGTILLPHGRYADELELYVERVGIDPLEVIRWGTRNGAELMGRADELGTLEPGKLADLLVIDGDPSSDVRVLQQPERLVAILKDGAFKKDRLQPPA